MSDKRSTAKPKQPEAGQTQENSNQLYTAHQVHTLAQLLFQRVSGYRNPMPYASHQPQPGMAGMAWPMQQAPTTQPFAQQQPQPCTGWPTQQAPTAQSFAPSTPPGVIYWYP